MSVTTLIWFGLEVTQRFSAVNNLWQEYNRQASTTSTSLARLRGAIGYGGLIHNFKNYVLRRDPKSLAFFEANVETYQSEIKKLATLLPTKAEKKRSQDNPRYS